MNQHILNFTRLTVLGLVVSGNLSWAQDYERVAPKVPAVSRDRPSIAVAEDPAVDSSEGARLLARLRGLHLVGSTGEIVPNGRSETGVTLAPELAAQAPAGLAEHLQPAIGQELTQGGLNRLTRDIVLFYRAKERPVVDIIVPEQDITSGVVQLIVLEGKVAKKRVEGARWTRQESLTGGVRLKEGDSIRTKDLMRDLSWFNRNPFRSVDMVYTPGVAFGDTDLVLRVRDRFPVRFYGGYENTGNDLTGYNRWFTGFNWNDAFGLHDHQASYQFTFNNDLDLLTAHSGSYVAPLPWRHILTFFGSYVESRADLPAPNNLTGESWQISARYAVPLPMIGPIEHELVGGFDFKQSNNNLEFGGLQVFNTATDINQFMLGYNLAASDPYGRTSGAFSAFISPGGLAGNNTDATFNAARSGASADYSYVRMVLERVTKLPLDFSWVLRGTVQTSSGNLLASEQLGFGGFNSVRGYEEREVNGDEGYIFTTELRTPAISLFQFFDTPEIKDELQFLFFWDYGVASNVNRLPGENANVELSGIGPGLRYAINPYLTVRFDYGFQLTDSGFAPLHRSRGNIGVTVAY